MEVELLIRWMKPKTKERETLERERTLFEEKYGITPAGELEPETYDEVFSYDPMTFRMEDILRFGKLDREHTTLIFNDGSKYAAKVDYSTFRAIWEGLMMRRVMVLGDKNLRSTPNTVIDY